VISKNSEKLRRTVDFEKSSMISQFPEYLTVNFVRFFWKPKEQVKAKILKKVKFPVNLNMSPFAKPDAGIADFELISIITHIGRSADSGHYIAWVRDLSTGNAGKMYGS